MYLQISESYLLWKMFMTLSRGVVNIWQEIIYHVAFEPFFLADAAPTSAMTRAASDWRTFWNDVTDDDAEIDSTTSLWRCDAEQPIASRRTVNILMKKSPFRALMKAKTSIPIGTCSSRLSSYLSVLIPKTCDLWAVVVTVAQLVERLLLTPEVCSSNPVIGKLLYWTFVYCQLYWKIENKEKEAGNGPFLKTSGHTNKNVGCVCKCWMLFWDSNSQRLEHESPLITTIRSVTFYPVPV